MAQLTTAIWSRDLAARDKAWKQLRGMKAAPRLLETLAYGLTCDDPKHRLAAMLFVREALPDKRLAPSLIACIRKARRQTLIDALRTAKALRDPALIPVILEHGVTSSYGRMVETPTPMGVNRHFISAFGEAAEALHAITNGKIGLKQGSGGDLGPNAKAEQEKLIATWRAWWEANKPKEAKQPGSKDGASRPHE